MTVDDLASHAAVSLRTLARRFAEQLGTSPGHRPLRQRLMAARALLEETDLPVETIAAGQNGAALSGRSPATLSLAGAHDSRRLPPLLPPCQLALTVSRWREINHRFQPEKRTRDGAQAANQS
ncbi:helix-turn-helix domain-containing protein [Streptomyces sp. NPDC059861]|uniref:helix-turn-helix domain-containing protein n=1 Tax=Streptomyces sp. NPDC059861 TaxID=3346974 RepID=UPI00366663B9